MLRDITRPNIPLIQNSDGILLFNDTTRNKMISVTRENLSFGIKNKNISGDRWLQTTANIPSNILGYKIPRNGTITSITIQTQNMANCAFEIKKNNAISAIHTMSLSNESEQINDNLNIDVNLGDYIQTKLLVNSGNVDYPLLYLEIAWR
jgi:hypothetical protein